MEEKEIILLGYPRSGNNFLRYVLEYLTEYDTKLHGVKDDCGSSRGPLRFLTEKISDKVSKGYVYHTHLFDFKRSLPLRKVLEKAPMIFIMRNYKESIIRHNFIKGESKYGDCDVINEADVYSHIDDWMNYLNSYDKCEAPKLLIKYEDLIDPEKVVNVLRDISEFFGVVNSDKIDKFISEYSDISKDSMSIYPDKGMSGGSTNVYHRVRVDDTIWENIDNKIKSKYPNLSNTYLKDYLT